MNASKILFSFIAGAAVGGALGILFAPDKGTETRRRIAEKSNDMADSVKDKFNEFVDGVKDKFNSAKNEAEDVAERGFNSYKRTEAM